LRYLADGMLCAEACRAQRTLCNAKVIAKDVPPLTFVVIAEFSSKYTQPALTKSNQQYEGIIPFTTWDVSDPLFPDVHIYGYKSTVDSCNEQRCF